MYMDYSIDLLSIEYENEMDYEYSPDYYEE